MRAPNIPTWESERIEALLKLEVLDTDPEERFDRITRLLSRLLNVPIALVSLIDKDRQWFKSNVGLDASETERDISFCGHAILNDETFVIEDASQDPRFHDNPLVTGYPNIRFYAGRPIKTNSGYRVGTLCAIDHTPRRLSADELSAMDDLAKIVENELDNITLLKLSKAEREIRLNAETALSELTKLKRRQDQLFGMVAHELRTPVAAIKMMADQHDNDEWLSDRKNVMRSADDLLNTIDDMRLLISTDHQRPIRPEKFSVEDLNASVSSSVASIVAATGVSYQLYNTLPSHLMHDDVFETDVYRLRVGITNIIKNACLHSEGSHVWMISRIHIDDDLNQYLDWWVADDGVGIPKAQINKFFELGVRGDTKAEGAGLGLYITKTWLAEIGGKVEYRHRRSGGSEFLVRVPLKLADKTAGQQPEPAKADKGLDGLLPQLNVLLVEDEALLRMLSKKLLEPLVGHIDVTENGSSALRKFDASHNLILTDYFMPQMSGVELTSKLRAQGYDGVIIGVTAATIGEQRDEMLNAGVDIVLPKPLNKEIFKNAIYKLMEQGRFDDLIRETQA